jgi:hypothetical protein
MSDGHIVYQGDSKKSVDYFNMIQRPVPKNCNPTDFFMKLLSINYPKKKEDEEKLEYLNRNYHLILEKGVKAESKLIRLDPPNMAGKEKGKATVSTQISLLMDRSWILAKREPRLNRAKIVQAFLMNLLMIPVFWQLNDFDAENSTAADDMTGAIYFLCFLQTLFNVLPTVIVF